jgi:endoglucanase
MPDLTRRTLITGTLAAGLWPIVRPALAAQSTTDSRLDRGFNLPGWADRSDGIAPASSLLRTLAHLGFKTVRLPLDPARILRDPRPLLNNIRHAASQLQTHGFTVTLDLHPEPDYADLFAKAPDEAASDMQKAWSLLAPLLADFSPETTFAELLNEPPMPRDIWLPLRDRLAETVRTHCPLHTIIWGAARVQGIWETRDHPPLDGANTIAAVHYYTPIGFTHQCADWSGPELAKLRNLPFPARKTDAEITRLRAELEKSGEQAAIVFLDEEFAGDWTYARIDKDFADLREWSNRNNCPVLLNEFGVLNFCVDAQSRLNWITSVRQAAETNKIPWTYWEVDRGFGVAADRTNPDSLDFALIAALIAG